MILSHPTPSIQPNPPQTQSSMVRFEKVPTLLLYNSTCCSLLDQKPRERGAASMKCVGWRHSHAYPRTPIIVGQQHYCNSVPRRKYRSLLCRLTLVRFLPWWILTTRLRLGSMPATAPSTLFRSARRSTGHWRQSLQTHAGDCVAPWHYSSHGNGTEICIAWICHKGNVDLLISQLLVQY
jgi:hypothetical protein